MTKQKPIFKKKEIVISQPQKEIDLGGNGGEIIAEVLYVGEQQELYKVGDKILLNYHKSNDDKAIKFFGQPYLIRLESEAYVLCKVEELNESL